ncbi:MAG: aminomethyl-transferring glycine dehydrogenase subunit GcvPA [Clostridiales bacterium]
MNKYIPKNNDETNKMMEKIGIDENDLFKDVNINIRIDKLNIPEEFSEIELLNDVRKIANKNSTINQLTCFLGAGVYDHYIPSVIDDIISRQEFYTSYTSYQPEISQGNLQAIFEYQTMICELTGMEVTNSSMYDGATATAEAMNMACNLKNKNKVLISQSVHPETVEVVKTYGKYLNKEINEFQLDDFGGVNIEDLESKISDETGAVIIQSPNFFGIIENISKISDIVHKNKAYLIVIVDPLSLAILEPAGSLGADITVGDGQVLGNSLNFGGPHLGFFSTSKKLMRKMPGRLVGETKDKEGKRAFVLTIQTREQHIRREKATSNICSNHALNALIASIYLTTMGKEGIIEVANLCLQKAHYLYDLLISTNLFEPVFKNTFFKEFTLKYKKDGKKLNEFLYKNNILGGYLVENIYPKMKGYYLIAVTEKRTREDMDNFVNLITRNF